MLWRAGVLLVLVGGACRFDDAGAGAAVDAGGDVIIDARPPGDVDASSCTAADDHVCLDGSTLQICVGGQLGNEVCADGCTGAPGEAFCRGFDPGNGLDPGWLDGATATLEIRPDTLWVLDSDTGSITDCRGGVIRAAGPGVRDGVRFEVIAGTPAIGVFAFTTLRIRPKADLVPIGSRAVALFAAGEVRIEEHIHAGGGADHCSLAAACGAPPDDGAICAGPGGFPGGGPGFDGGGPGGGRLGEGSAETGVSELGGGGAGFGSPGGQGGSFGGAGGPAHGETRLEPLIGGSGGGGGGTGASFGGRGGGGGGGLQITSLLRIQIGKNGGVESGGAGGLPGVGADGSGGGGGGSGGAILLEAPELRIDGELAANGGGGGGANLNGGNFGETAGGTGGFGTTSTPGGDGAAEGGTGGAGESPAGGAGAPALFDIDGGAGGGGAAGRLVLRTVAGGLYLGGDAVLSPEPLVLLDLIR